MALAPTPDRADTGVWTSLVLRIAIAALFFAASFPKLTGGKAGILGVVQHFSGTFEKTWLPMPLVKAAAYTNPFIEGLIVIWLLSGLWLRVGWIFTTLFLVSLGFGMAVAQQHQVAAQNYLYVLIAATGLYMSRYDRFSIDGLRRRNRPTSTAVR